MSEKSLVLAAIAVAILTLPGCKEEIIVSIPPDLNRALINSTTAPRAAPTIQNVAPSYGPMTGGTTLTVYGTGFFPGSTLVIVGGILCEPVQYLSSTSVSCLTGPSTVPGLSTVTLIGPDNRSTSKSAAYIYQDSAPIITSVSPNSALFTGNIPITISGSGFKSGAYVSVDGTTCRSAEFVDSTTINCTIPPHSPGVANVTVTNRDLQSSNSLPLTYRYGAPILTSISPNIAFFTGEITITLRGSGFLSGAIVLVDRIPCRSAVVTSTTITCTIPFHDEGVVDVKVTNRDLQSSNSLQLTYTNDSTLIPAGKVSFKNSNLQPGISAIRGIRTVVDTEQPEHSAYDSHSCALLSDGHIECWGKNDLGQLGNGTLNDSAMPQPILGLGAGARSLVLGNSHSCAVASDSTLWCWGSNANGQLGNLIPSGTFTPTPVQFPNYTDVLNVSASKDSTCVITPDQMECFGLTAP